MKTILFDLDGTLIQTPTIILEAFKQTFKMHLKEVELSEKELSNFLGQTLLYLKKQGCQIGIVTSKLKDVATYHLKLTNLFEDVDLIVGYEDAENHKPHPDPLLKAIELLNAKKEDTIYIGDHENDIKAAKKAGIESCAVTYSNRLHEMLLEQPEYVIDNLDNLTDII
jgi:HAD superfamily hydrolase (TIGR01662 family)